MIANYTNNKSILQIFEQWQTNPTVLYESTMILLNSIVGKGGALFMKRNLPNDVRTFREACKQQLLENEAEINRENTAEGKVAALQYKVGVIFDTMENEWKFIENVTMDRHPEMVQTRIKEQGRMFGLKVSDLTCLPSGIYTMDALVNLSEGKDKTHNTHEHFYSLYANAGPTMLQTALDMRTKFDIFHLAPMIFKYNQTIRSTKSENDRLSSYHKSNEFVSPAVSYRQVGINNLVFIPKQADTLMRLTWELFLDKLEVDHRYIKPPFENLMTLEQAVRNKPSLSNIYDILKINRK